MRNIGWIGFVFLVLTACKKDLPEIQNTNEPVFYVRGNIDGQEIHFDAGDSDYLMESSKWYWQNVPVYQGRLFNPTNSFVLNIIGGDVLSGEQIEPLLALTELRGAYNGETSVELNVSQLVNSSGIGGAIWDLNGVTSGESLFISEPGVYTLGLNTVGIPNTNISNELVIGYKAGLFKLKATVQNQLVSVRILENEFEIDHVKWEYGIQELETSEGEVDLQLLTGSNELKATVRFTNGKERVRKIIVGQGQNISVEDFIFPLESQFQEYFDYTMFTDFKLDTEIYTSLYAIQQDAFPLIITEKEVFEDPWSGNQVLKVSFNLVMMLRKESNGQLVDASFEGVVALPIAN